MTAGRDPFEGLDHRVRRALESWQALGREQRDYAMGVVAASAPEVVISAAKTAVEITRLNNQFTCLEAQQ
ncbi:hypothetical protein [Nocardia arthritidis]|uniref:Uncharacterized protein n=1 Tax=Nocardia arthritidis TaxID=228602 RepID=A0A6G9YC56_9NOCA|nr:hypothetical protein [Nocardia arthritidis]QIS10636.1 hypothetical protein F5544_13740 [Nocardia arthritidis]